jgi:transcriptional regulator with XRE-family HTH domain/tetratricopeptide (TPR) repeat protein
MDLTDGLRTFGDLLRRHRVLAGMSQEELAERARLSARAISDLERGVKRTPRRDTVQLLVEALELEGEARTAFVTAAREPAPRRPSRPAGQAQQAVAPPPQASASPTGGFLGALPEGRLIGREAELSRVKEEIESVMGGSRRLLVVAGEPGVGKTRLSQEATLACRDRGFVVATGRCYEPHRTVPYYPFLEALSSLYGAAPYTVRAQVPTRWPYVMELLPEGPGGALTATGASPQEEQQRLFRAVTGLLRAISEVAPVALLFDDLHWADDASVELLQHLARHARAHRVLLLGSYRDVEVGHQHPLERALRDLERERLVERVSVRRLDHEGTASLISDRLGQDLSGEFVDLVHRHTDGHPLFVQEVLRALVERGAVYRRDGRWTYREVAEIGVPESVRATIADRASRLGERAQGALRGASVLGQAFDFEDLRAMVGLSEDELEAALEEALAAGLVYESGDGYVFNHALTQQALYMELPRQHRRRLHLNAGEALERLAEPARRRRATELAWHFREGGDTERTLPYMLVAGDNAVSVHAPGEAESHYRASLELARALDDRAVEARVLEKLGWLMWITARFDACSDALKGAARLYRHAGDVEGEARTAALLGMVHFTYAPLEGAERIRGLLDRLGPEGSSESLVSLYASLSMNLIVAGRYNEALEAAEDASEVVARASGDGETLAWVQRMRGTALGLMGRLEEGLKILGENLSLAETDNDYWGQLSVAHYLGKMSVARGDFDAALRYHGRSLELAERLGARSRVSAETSNLSEVLFYLGDWERARPRRGRGRTGPIHVLRPEGLLLPVRRRVPPPRDDPHGAG